MKRWEYKTRAFGIHAAMTKPDAIGQMLNDCGGEGWELVGFFGAPQGMVLYIFKRPLDPLDDFDWAAEQDRLERQERARET